MRLRIIGINDPKITAHSLRHTCGSLLVEMGTDIEIIKDLLGHSDSSTTRIYVDMAQKRRLLRENPSRQIEALLAKK
jgi:site-specific recombinase XerD